ncbi:MAG TPA: TetR/AcrR family transcriptional regulator [Pseudonocardiaceae bacterium]|jgi:AcrR family transcriptional regulator|nr:TetR/AcrR family transcriptional regulator [Pseudonocardiaceae bacterium]
MTDRQPGRGRGRPRSERARLAILAAAGELMLAGGVNAASMEAIAERAGVSKATIYKWWPSRGAVALDGFLAQAQDTIAIPEGLSTREALHFQVLALIRLFRDTPSGPLMRALVSQAECDPEIARAVRERWLAPRRAVAMEIVRAGVASGEFRPDIDPASVSDQLFAPIYHRLIFGHEPLDDELADRLVDQAVAGLCPVRS